MLIKQKDQVYDWKDPDSDQEIHFFVTAILYAVEHNQIPFLKIETELNEDYLDTWVTERIDPIRYAHLTEEELDDPIIGGELLLT